MTKKISLEVNKLISQNKDLNYNELSELIEKELGVTQSYDSIRKRYKDIFGTLKNLKVNKSEFKSAFIEKVYTKIKKKKGISIEELSDFFNIGVKTIREAITELEKQHKKFHFVDNKIELAKEIQSGGTSVLDDYHFKGEWIKFGFITDMHYGSKYERRDVVETAYDNFERQGIKIVYLAGNMIEGEARFNKFDLHTVGLGGQVNYFVENYPKRKDIKTYYITGDDHEGWYTQREGIDVGQYIQFMAEQKGRYDLIYLSHMEHDIVINKPQGDCTIRIVHPGGGSSYAISYKPQKIVESYSSGEKPTILLMGHYHKASYNYYRSVHIIQGGCAQDQTPFMRKKHLQAHVGYWMISVKVGDNGAIQRIKHEFVPFFDRKYYDKKWNYKW